jgi:PIN domain
MSANDSLLFIDANKYLDLFRIDQGKKLLAPLGEQIDYIFVTQQVVNEVQRNKILVAADFLRKKSKELKLQTFNLPDHLSNTSIDQRNDILKGMSEIAQKIKDMNAEIDALVLGLMKQISCSEDEVSKALSLIFANSIPHSSEELQRARERRELGNPPGKNTNPIGDQLTWEQILTHFKDKKRLWIISRDSDYGTVYSGKGFLNRFLYDELCKVTSEPEVYLFEDIVEGINHFIDTTGVKAEKRLTPEETEEIEREEKAIPNPNQSSESISKMFQNMDQLSQPNDSLRKVLENMALPNDGLRKIRESMAMPNDNLRKALESMAMPNDNLRKALENIAMPNDGLQKALENIAMSNDSLRKALENIAMPEKPQALPPSTEENENDDKNEEGRT